MEQILLNKCKFCKNYGQAHGTQGICTLMNVPVRGEWQACRMGVLVFTCEERIQAESLDADAISPSAQPFQYTHAQVPQDEMWLTGSTHHSRHIGQEAI